MEFAAPVRVPPSMGWRFRPSDNELAGYYLLHKVSGCSFPYAGIVHDFDVFGKQEPWQIWSMFRSENDDDNDDDLYFFTKRKKTTPEGKRFNRKVGFGTWKGQDSGTEIYDADNVNVVGLKKRFHYENKQSKEQDGSWIMFEYCLAGSLAHCITGPHNDFVLCQIRKKIRSAQNDKKRKSIDTQSQPQPQPQPPFPIPLPCPRVQQHQPCLADHDQSSLPIPIIPHSLPLPVLDDDFDTILPQQPLPLPLPFDDDFDDLIALFDFGF